ncbi:MAG: 2Fe-2S iron-sulfur cluster binding domain-containing protein [Steroidobacteraceae bacterium]|nr:2Fe-2S iron-sulfur cluster binding domain-containing protein [Steroidobacteraceae bacterium]
MHLTDSCVVFAVDAGIVPAVTLVKRLLAEDGGTRVLAFCGAQEGEHAEPLEELLALKDVHLHRLSLGFVMDREPGEAELLSGTLDAAKARDIATRLFDARAVNDYYVCGPEQLVADVTRELAALGVDPSRVRRAGDAAGDTVPPPRAAPQPTAPASAAPSANETRVEFVMDGRRRSFTMRTGFESILDAAARAGIELPFSCKAGVCSTCRTKLVRGEVDMAENYALEDWELEQGFILACQSRARTPEIELNYDET